MPEAGEALPAFIEQIRNEARTDYTVDAKDLLMDDDGTLWWRGRAWKISEDSFPRLINHVLPVGIPRPTGYWMALPPERRAAPFVDAARNSNRRFNMRVRVLGDVLEAFAVTSTRYTPVDNWRIARRLLEQVDPSTKTRVMYNGTRTVFDFIFHADLPVEGAAVGEFFKSAISFSTDDDGTEAIRSRVRLWRAICINFTTAEMAQNLLRRRHVGDPEEILQRIVMSAAEGHRKLAWFTERYAGCRHLDIRQSFTMRSPDGFVFRDRQYDLTSPRLIVEALINSWRIPGVTASDVAAAAEEAWFSESPDWSITGISNAITKAAHTGRWSSSRVQEALEDVGGRMIMQKFPELVYVEA